MRGLIYNHELLRAEDARQNPNVSKLCHEIGISRTMYYKVLNGKGGSPAVVSRVARALSVDPMDVIRLAENISSFA